MTRNQLELIAAHLNVKVEDIKLAKEQFTFKGGRVLLVTVVGKSPRFVSTKVIMTETTKLIAYFSNHIDNDVTTNGYNFKTRKEAMAIAASLTTNKLTMFEWLVCKDSDNDKEPYLCLSFIEQVETEIVDNGCTLYSQIDKNLDGQIKGGTFKSLKRAK